MRLIFTQPSCSIAIELAYVYIMRAVTTTTTCVIWILHVYKWDNTYYLHVFSIKSVTTWLFAYEVSFSVITESFCWNIVISDLVAVCKQHVKKSPTITLNRASSTFLKLMNSSIFWIIVRYKLAIHIKTQALLIHEALLTFVGGKNAGALALKCFCLLELWCLSYFQVL